MAEDPRSGFTEVQGIRLHYREWGDPGAPDLLLVHGWTNYSLGWAGVAEHFAGRYHVVAPDLRGHGESDKPQTGYRLRDFAEDVHQFIANLEARAPGLRRPLLGRQHRHHPGVGPSRGHLPGLPGRPGVLAHAARLRDRPARRAGPA